jgi:hypothetical protein
VALVQSLADQGLDDRLPTDVEFLGEAFQFFEHGAVKSTFTRWIGFIMRPELVKKRETSLPWSGIREMDSADAGFFLRGVFFIKYLFFPDRLRSSNRNRIRYNCYTIRGAARNQGETKRGPTSTSGATAEAAVGEVMYTFLRGNRFIHG